MSSSVIRQFGYDEADQRLTITFVSGDVYAYLDVPPMVAEGLRIASSKGQFFSARIRDHYPFERVRIGTP